MFKKKLSLLLLPLLFSMATAVFATEDAIPFDQGVDPSTMAKPTITYACDHGVSLVVEFSADEVLLVLDGQAIPLTKIPSTSGASYGDGTMTLIIDGEKSRVEEAGAILFSNCKALAS